MKEVQLMETKDKVKVLEGLRDKLMHFKCPNCNQYVRAPVSDTRTIDDFIRRRRRCEKCGWTLLTNEFIVAYHPKWMPARKKAVE